jgi:hypothetical protein
MTKTPPCILPYVVILATGAVAGCGNASSNADDSRDGGQVDARPDSNFGADGPQDGGHGEASFDSSLDSGSDSGPRPDAGSGTTVFNCGSIHAWSTSAFPANGCGVNSNPYPKASTDFFINNTAAGNVAASSVELVPANGGHNGWGLIYYEPVNDQAFSTTFTFIPNGFNLAFTLNNDYTPNGGSDFPWAFNAGAGGEAGFSQFAGASNNAPYNVFALELDSYSPLTASGSFTYSSAQIYQSSQSPALPPAVGSSYPTYLPEYATNKISTAPVPLNDPPASRASASTDVFSATILYTGTNVTLRLFDVTAGGSCPSSKCFSYTWEGVNIPGIAGGPWTDSIDSTSGVGGTTAYVGFNAGTSLGTGPALEILSWRYDVLSAADSPTFSKSAGTYAATQSVRITDSSPGAIVCYSTLGPPSTDGATGCTRGKLYTGAISVSSGQTLYAVAGGSGYGDSKVASAEYQIASTASQPTFNPPAGTYQGAQTVYLSAPSGQSIHYNTTGSPSCLSSTYAGPIAVTSNETIHAIACGPGLTNSLVGSASYTLNPFAGSGAPNAADAPTFSPPPGTYSGPQTVTISSTTPDSYICYTLSSTPPMILPQPDNGRAALPPNGSTVIPGACNAGTYYTGPVSLSSSQTLYAITGTTFSTLPSSAVAAPYVIK